VLFAGIIMFTAGVFNVIEGILALAREDFFLVRSRGLVIKRACATDGRGNVARLTERGLAKLESAWPAHLASVRRRVFDHIDAAAVERAAQALSSVAAHLEDKPHPPDGQE